VRVLSFSFVFFLNIKAAVIEHIGPK